MISRMVVRWCFPHIYIYFFPGFFMVTTSKDIWTLKLTNWDTRWCPLQLYIGYKPIIYWEISPTKSIVIYWSYVHQLNAIERGHHLVELVLQGPAWSGPPSTCFSHLLGELPVTIPTPRNGPQRPQHDGQQTMEISLGKLGKLGCKCNNYGLWYL